MFVGHYGPSYLGKKLGPGLPLWLLFVAVQFLDVLWSIFVLLGIEKLRIVPGITASNALDLYYMPFTHSLVGALGWSLLAGLLWRLFRRGERAWRESVVLAAAVFSHWLLDLFVHRPDLALIDDHLKVGFGLWNFPWLAFALEALVLVGGLVAYLRGVAARNATNRVGAIVLVTFFVLLQAARVAQRPVPSSERAMAISALVAYVLFALVTAFLDRPATPGSESSGA